MAGLTVGCRVPDNALSNWRYYAEQPQHLFIEPVAVQAPEEGAVLFVERPFRLQADLWLNYEVGAAEIELWDVTTGWQHRWHVDNPNPAAKWSMDLDLTVPEDSPPGRDYRLHVVAQPAVHRPSVMGAQGYSVRVAVAGQPKIP